MFLNLITANEFDLLNLRHNAFIKMMSRLVEPTLNFTGGPLCPVRYAAAPPLFLIWHQKDWQLFDSSTSAPSELLVFEQSAHCRPPMQL